MPRAIPYFPEYVPKGGRLFGIPPPAPTTRRGSSSHHSLNTLRASPPSRGQGRHFVDRLNSPTLRSHSRGRADPPGQLNLNGIPLLGCSGTNWSGSAWFFKVTSGRVKHHAPPLLLSRHPRQLPRPRVHLRRLAFSGGSASRKRDHLGPRILLPQYLAFIRLGSSSERNSLCRSPGASVN